MPTDMRGRLRARLSRLVWPDAVPHSAARSVFAHEWFTTLGGSDRVAARLIALTRPDVVYCFALDDALIERLGIDVPVVTWRYGRAAARVRRFHWMLPVMVVVWRMLDVRATTVLTSSHSCVNCLVAPDARRTSYVHTPMRYAWDWRLERDRASGVVRLLLPLFAPVFRAIDRWAARGVDVFIANSAFVADRIRRSYGREAVVVHPPVELSCWSVSDDLGCRDERPFLVAGRFVAYKRTRLAVDAARLAGVDLVIAGNGPELADLAAAAGPSTTIIVDPPDIEFAELLRNARALLLPGIEDFGILPVEAQACGTPVIARNLGGATETVTDGVSGILVDSDTPGDWARVLSRFRADDYQPAAVRRSVERFDVAHFDAGIRRVLGTGGSESSAA